MTTTPSAVRNIPLDKLVPSPTNVRKTPPSAAEDAELKASIRTRGLKQNLVVHPSPGEKGIHAVTAGGRRLRALQELAAEGVIPADFRVPCLVEEPEAAVETSLMENRIRAALSPADEFVAMAELIEQRLEELQETPEGEWTDALITEAARLEERRDELAESVADLAVYSEKDRAIAGVIVTIGDDGGFRLHEGLIERSATDTGDIGDDETVGFEARRDDEICHSSPDAEQALRKECGFSQLLVDDLKAYRLQITRAHLAADFEVAFDLALYALCVDLFDRFRHRSHPLDLRVTETPLHSSLNDLGGTAADRLLEARGPALDLDWLKLRPADGFAALAALSMEAKQRLFARCIALCLKPQLAIEDGADPVIEAAGSRLAIPFADYWRPTAANYWGRVKKAHGVAIGSEILGDRWTRDHAGDKKPELAAALEAAFDPAKSTACVGLERAAREAAAAWLPPGVAYADPAANNPSTDPQWDEAAPLAGNADDGKPTEIDLQAAELPAFLTEDERAMAGTTGL